MKFVANVVTVRWLCIIITGLYLHYHTSCVCGFCIDYMLISFKHDFASFVFLTAMLVTIAEFDTFPYGLRRLPFVILIIYEVFVALLFSNAGLYLVWLPLLQTMSNFLINISYRVKEHNFENLADVLQSENCLQLVTIAVSLLFLVTAIYITDLWTEIKDTFWWSFIAKIKRLVWGPIYNWQRCSEAEIPNIS